MTTESKHTQLPWVVSQSAACDARIVKACNQHDALVKIAEAASSLTHSWIGKGLKTGYELNLDAALAAYQSLAEAVE